MSVYYNAVYGKWSVKATLPHVSCSLDFTKSFSRSALFLEDRFYSNQQENQTAHITFK